MGLKAFLAGLAKYARSFARARSIEKSNLEGITAISFRRGVFTLIQGQYSYATRYQIVFSSIHVSGCESTALDSIRQLYGMQRDLWITYMECGNLVNP